MHVRTKINLDRMVIIQLLMIFLLLSGLLVVSIYSNSFAMHPMNLLIDDFYEIDGFIDAFEECEKNLYDYRWDSEHLVDEQTHKDLIYGSMEQMGTYLSRIMDRISVDSQPIYQNARALNNMYPHYINYVTLFCNEMASQRRNSAIELYYANEKLTSLIRSYASALLRVTVQGRQKEIKTTQHSLSYLWILQAFFCFLCLALVLLLASRLFNILLPVGRLIHASEELQKQHYDTPDVPENCHNVQICQLVKAFNHMKHSTARLVTTLQEHNETLEQLRVTEARAMESQRLAEQAKLSSLRSQINPHFLFNTLNTIRRLAHVEHAQQTQELILSLSRIMRYSLSNLTGPVLLEKEINVTKEYFKIQHARFGERVRLEWHIAPLCSPESLLIPPFILQTLVENSIKHGLEPKPEGGEIHVYLYPQQDMLHIIVEDNGCGMSPETLESVRKGQRPTGSSSGIGLSNVTNRLKLLDSRNRILIESKQGVGIHITLILPIQYQEDEDAANSNC